MKSKTSFFFSLFLFFSIFSFSQKIEDIYGNWKAIDIDKNIGEISFSEDSFVSFIVNGQKIDGKNFIIHGGPNNGKKGMVKYKIDFEVFPYKLFIYAYFDDNGNKIEKGILNGLIKFINKDELLILLDFENKGYKDFDENNKRETAHLFRIINE